MILSDWSKRPTPLDQTVGDPIPAPVPPGVAEQRKLSMVPIQGGHVHDTSRKPRRERLHVPVHQIAALVAHRGGRICNEPHSVHQLRRPVMRQYQERTSPPAHDGQARIRVLQIQPIRPARSPRCHRVCCTCTNSRPTHTRPMTTVTVRIQAAGAPAERRAITASGPRPITAPWAYREAYVPVTSAPTIRANTVSSRNPAYNVTPAAVPPRDESGSSAASPSPQGPAGGHRRPALRGLPARCGSG